MKEDIKKFIDTLMTNLYLDDADENTITYITRENGDVGREKASRIDIEDARQIQHEVIVTFKDKVKTEVEIIDEWVHLTIEIL
jgi:phage terminase small subunit